MKSFLLMLVLLTLSTLAQAQVRLNPYCYTGEMVMEGSQESRKVFLKLDSLNGNYYFVNTFQLGNYAMTTSGKKVSANKIQFNSNNDYIPGGNASYNLDIELVFDGKNVAGEYNYYTYEDHQGHGGFGQGKQAGKTPVESGRIELRLCRTEIVIE